MFQSGSSLLAKNGIGPVLVFISLSRRYGRRCHEEGQIQRSACRFCVVDTRSTWGVGNGDKEREWEGAMTPEEREGEASYRRLTGRKGRELGFGCTREPFSASFWSRVETGGTTVEVKRQHQKWRMTSSSGRVQNSVVQGGGRSSGGSPSKSYGWKGGRFWPRKRSFSASIPQVLRFYL